MDTSQLQVARKESRMPQGMKSFIPQLLKQKNLTPDKFRGLMLLNGLSVDTANRAMAGDTDFTTKTLEKIARILNAKSISELVELKN